MNHYYFVRFCDGITKFYFCTPDFLIDLDPLIPIENIVKLD